MFKKFDIFLVVDIGKKSTLLTSNKVLIKENKGRYFVKIFGDKVNIY